MSTSRLTGGIALAALMALAACGGGTPAERLERAERQFAEGDLRTASIELRNVLQAEPDNRDARLLLGLAALELGDAAGAVEQLGRARDLGAPASSWALPLGQAQVQTGRGAAAMRTLEEVEEAERDDTWLLLRSAALATDGDLDGARDAARQVLARSPEHVEATVQLGRLSASAGDNDEARRQAVRAIELDPNHPGGHLLLGGLELTAGNTAAAIDALDTAAQLAAATPVDSDELGALASLAQAYMVMNDREGLRRTRDRLQARAPDTPIAAYVRGAVLHLEGNHREAARSLQAAVDAAGDNAQVLLLHGANELALGNLGQAEQALTRALSLQPHNPAAIRLLATTRREQGRPRAALETLAGIQDDDDPQLMLLRGVLLLEDGRTNDAVRQLERAGAAAPDTPAVQLQLARAYMAAGRNDEAVALFEGPMGAGARDAIRVALELLAEYSGDGDEAAAQRRADAVLDERGDDAQAVLGVALFEQALGRGGRARELIGRSLEVDPGLNVARVMLAGLAAAEGDTAAAREHYRTALEYEPGNAQALGGLARLAEGEGALDEAAGYLDAAVEADPENLAVHLALARLRLSLEQVDAAEAAIEAAAAAHPDNAELATYRALVRYQRGDHEGAIAEFRRAVDADRSRADRWFNLARAQYGAERYADARDSLLAAREIQPAPAVLSLLAQVQRQLGEEDEALQAARDLQRSAPDSAEGFVLEGNVHASRGQWREADRYFVQGYEREPGFDPALRAYQARRQGRLGEPTELLERWVAERPDEVRARLVIAEYLQGEGRADEALEAYEGVIRRDAGNVVALNNAAWLLAEQERYDRALDYARRALDAAPDAAPVLDTYGWALVRSGRVDDGLPYLERAVELAPQSAELRFHLGSAQASAGRAEEARATLDALLADNPDFERRDEARRLLESL